MVITESELRELWRDGRHPLPTFPPGTRFSPAAQDFLKDHDLTPVFGLPASTANGSPSPTNPHPPASSLQSPASFLARLDTLQALTGLVAAEARRAHLPELAAHLDTLSAYAAELRAATANGRPAPTLRWGSGVTAAPARPGPHDHPVAHWLNYLRASTQEAALAAPEAVAPGLRALAAAADDLLAGFLSGQLAWKTPIP